MPACKLSSYFMNKFNVQLLLSRSSHKSQVVFDLLAERNISRLYRGPFPTYPLFDFRQG